MNGVYRPAVGDFDGNGSDDVLWGHGAGSRPLWLATGALGTACAECFTKTSRIFAGSGSWAPPADVDGDGLTDVVWYGAGAGADALWRATGDGVFAKSALSINGTYRPVVREAFNQDQIVWYNAAGVDLQWDYDNARPVRPGGLPPSRRRPHPPDGLHRARSPTKTSSSTARDRSSTSRPMSRTRPRQRVRS